VYVPIVLNTRRNASGRSQATVKAQIAPELAPPIAQSFGSVETLYFRRTSGSTSSRRKRAYRSPMLSYSKLRLNRGSAPGFAAGTTPGLRKTPIVTGISPAAIRLSKTTGTRHAPSRFTYPPPS
jgi:hypothetical protein